MTVVIIAFSKLKSKLQLQGDIKMFANLHKMLYNSFSMSNISYSKQEAQTRQFERSLLCGEI